MSSMLRTLQKRLMKKTGLSRQKKRIEVRDGVLTAVEIPKGQRPIIDGLGEKVGMHWPTRFAMPTNPQAKDLLARVRRDKAHGRIAA